MNEPLSLPSGALIEQPLVLADAFFEEEWAYYDGIADTSPDTIEPLDVIATVSVNSFVNSATRIRSVHRGIAEACNPILESIPVDADLRSYPIDPIIRLLDAACQVRYVLVPVAAKVLHRKRPSLLPMLDTVVSDYYLASRERLDLRGAREDKRRAAEAARIPLEAFRDDLQSSWTQLAEYRRDLTEMGWPATELRILEVLVWIWSDPLRQYRRLVDTGNA